MWTCTQCQADIEDEENFCYSCGASKSAGAEMWVCSKCNTQVSGDDAFFCSNCGQPKEKKKDAASQLAANTASAPQVVATASVNVAAKVVEIPKQPVYDASIFASQFPQWDLLPPAVLVRRIKRSI
jgi:uncharacterized membrane protein YvbJ